MNLKNFIQDLYSVKNTTFSANQISRFFGSQSVAGVTVNSNTAIQHSTVYSCIRDKAESIGQLPARLHRINKNNQKTEVFNGREHRIFTKKPNSFMTAQDFREMYVSCMELYGRFFAYVIRNDRGNISEVIPFRFQTSVSVNMDESGNVYYIYTTNDGKPNMGFTDNEIMHVKLNTLDGFTGLSPIACNARTLGLGISQETHMTKLMSNGAMPSGVLETDSVFKDPNRADRIREQFKKKYQSVANTGEVIFLEDGLKYKALTITPVDADLLKSMNYNREQTCGIFRVPPRRVGVTTSGSKQADVEQENKDYYVNGLMPLVTKYEDAWNEIIPDSLELKLDPKGFLRGDLESQTKAMGEMFKLTAISINELRAGIDLEPIENGHYHAIDTNNITLGTLDEVGQLQAEQRALVLVGNQNQEQNKPSQEDSDDET